MTATKAAQSHRQQNARAYKLAVANGKCGRCRWRKARRGRLCCKVCADYLSTYGRKRHADLLALIEAMTLEVEAASAR